MQSEINKVIELTGAGIDQIKLHDDGYHSRAYVVNKGEYVVKFPKFDSVDYSTEAQFLNFINTFNIHINMQKVKYLSSDNRVIAFYGVKGVPLLEINNLSLQQKDNITSQLAVFLKQLHSLNMDIGGKDLNTEINNYKKIYNDCSSFFNKHLTKQDKITLDILFNDYFASRRKALGEKLVLCHGDIWDSNIFINDQNKVGLIDCANAGYYDQATDFCFYDKTLRTLLLKHYGADDALREKAELKYAMSVTVSPKYITEIHGESLAVKNYLPLIKQVISKHKLALL